MPCGLGVVDTDVESGPGADDKSDSRDIQLFHIGTHCLRDMGDEQEPSCLA
jgi:hypothetical protein